MSSYTICVAETFEDGQWVPAYIPDQLPGWRCPGEIHIDWIKCHVPRYVIGPWSDDSTLQPDDLAPSTAEASFGFRYTVTDREVFEAIEVADNDARTGVADSADRWLHFRRDVTAGLVKVDRSKRCRLVIWVD